MNEATWLPGVVVLAAGLLVGLALAYRLRGSSRPKSAQTEDSLDMQLKVRDLEARRDDLYRRIRAAEEDNLSATEVAALEDAAALTLRDLDRHGGLIPEESGEESSSREKTETEARPAGAPGQGTRNPILVGFAFGAAMVAVISLLVYFAVKDAQPTAPMGPQTNQATGDIDPPHQGSMEIPPEVAERLAALQQQLASNPEDMQSRKEIALTYVAAGQFMEAFNEASQVLQQYPDDPDGLLVHGIVRLTMGQADQAVNLFDQVLAQYPDHRQALIYRGLALYQSGKVGQALDTWDMGLQMAGGSDPEFEELILMAQSGETQPAGMMPGNPQPAQAAQAPPVAQELDPNGFSATIQLAAGAQAAPQATLFVFLRPAAGGPPVAARRITGPRFPLQITLGVDDSMMGAELPASGLLAARLDADGNVATASPGDLAIEVSATKGELSTLTLGN